jgi:hypothetical protein
MKGSERSPIDQLPPETKAAVDLWLLSQKVVITCLGMAPEQWFAMIEWSLKHPGDLSFLLDPPDGAEL